MPSVSFNRAAHIYDDTRGYPEEMVGRIAQAIDATVQATAQTAILEIGIGTGRIAFPLASLGRMITGVDISEKMLGQLETKLRVAGWQEHSAKVLPWGSFADEDTSYTPEIGRFTQAQPSSSLRLVNADIEHLPFMAAAFEVAISVHVFHLVSNWQQVVREVMRVLRPGGVLLHCHDGYRESERKRINEQWRQCVDQLGGSTKRPGEPEQNVSSWLQTQGLSVEEMSVLNWRQKVVPRKIIESIEQRAWSSSWAVAEDIFDASIKQLWQWANSYYGAEIDSEFVEERYFSIRKVQM